MLVKTLNKDDLRDMVLNHLRSQGLEVIDESFDLPDFSVSIEVRSLPRVTPVPFGKRHTDGSVFHSRGGSGFKATFS